MSSEKTAAPSGAEPAETHWRGQHRPDDTGPTLDAAEVAFPDVYTQPRLYVHEREVDQESIAAIMSARAQPEMPVSVYRAVPPEVLAGVADPESLIGSGDWVSTSRAYATQHGLDAHDPSKDWPVVTRTVRADELRTEGNSVNEWGYFPLT